MLVVGVFGLVAGLLFAVYPPFQTVVMNQAQSVKEKVTGFLPDALSPIRPASVKASIQLKKHPGAHAFDVVTNTHWAAKWNPKRRPVLEIDLGKTVALRKLIITSGAKEGFANFHRPSRLHLAYSNDRNESILVQDSPDPQEIDVRAGLAVKSLTIEVLNVHQAGDASALAVTEIELFGVG